MKFLKVASITTALVLSTSVNSAVISMDRLTEGDGLITHDTVSGLDWLDLTETNNISRDYVLSQLGAGGEFEGFRYASSAEVVSLWANFEIDASIGTPRYYSGVLPGLVTATSYLGNVFLEEHGSSYPYGAYGLTSDRQNKYL